MSFTNTMKCFDKRHTTKSLNKIVPTPRVSHTEITQIKTILAEIGVEQENIGIATTPENNCEIFSPRRGLDLTAIKTKKLELEKSIKEYTRPEKPEKPAKPKKVIKAKIANKKVEKE